MGKHTVLDARYKPLFEYANVNKDRFLNELIEFLRIPSISTQPQHEHDMRRAAEWLQHHLTAIGFPVARVIETAGHPVVYAEWVRENNSQFLPRD